MLIVKYIHNYDSPLGKIVISSDGTALTGLCFEGQRCYDEILSGNYEQKELSVFAQAESWLDIYFSGQAPDFAPSLVLSGTPFRKAVWEIILSIPYGETMTYGEIAKIIAMHNGMTKMSAQAVGGAVGHNPVSIIVPCHRVVGANGRMTGYSGGIDKKIKLLALESSDKNTHIIL